jgi:ABC-type Na+ transport system ATPase subunit NatA
MYIKSLIYEDQSTGWKLEKIEFNNSLTLLVGVSGVGKTQILKALLNLKNISNGEHIHGLKWEIEFKINKDILCNWQGECEGLVTSGTRFLFEKEPEIKWNRPPIFYEKLFIDEELIVDRKQEGIFFKGSKTVQLPKTQSIVFLLKEEDIIKDIFDAFSEIYFDNNSQISPSSLCKRSDFDSFLNQYATVQSIRNSNQKIITKLYLSYKKNIEIFKTFKNLFGEIFPNIEDLAVDIISSLFPDSLYISIAIKEKNVEHWIHWEQISLGMRKTLIHLAELHLCADDSVILIDEFENSLGINCIDELTSSILTSERNLQFIITSHHPYIINDIGFSHWKIVTRKGSVVTATDADKLGIGRSKHQAFTQLANLTAYSEGIES